MKRVLGLAAAIAVLSAALFTEIGRTLLLGWLGFALERFPKARVNPTAVVTGLVVVALFVALVDLFARWCMRTRPRPRPSGVEDGAVPAPRPAWRFRWTASTFAAVCLMFAVGYCTIGLARHVGWLATSPEPLVGTSLRRYDSRSSSQSDLRLLGQAFQWYHDQHHALPPGGTFDEFGRGLHSWATHLLPYLNYAAEIKMELPWDHPDNAGQFRCVVPEFINPRFRTAELRDAEGFGLSHYAANSRVLAPGRAVALEEIKDGLSNTILVGEVNHVFRPWGDPVNARDPAVGIDRRDGFGGPPGARGACFLMADGSVRVLGQDTDPAIVESLATPSAGDGKE